MNKTKLIRITTVPISLEKLLENQLTFMSNYFDITAISSNKKQLKKFGIENNIKTKHIELTRKITPLQDLKALWKLYKFLKKEKPEIVHSHTPKAGTIAMLAAKLAGVPNRLHTIAGLPLLETKGIKRTILNIVEKITYAAATQILPNSYGLKQIILVKKFCKESKLKVIANGSSNGINTAYFNPANYLETENEKLRKRINILKNDFVFIFVGRLVSDKGINELVNAFENINNKFTNTKLLLVGALETELDPLENKTIVKIKNHNNIISVGYQQDVRPYFAIANVLTFPSYREGFPNVVLQAAAMNLPSIVTNINGCNEIIKHHKNGLIIPVKDKKALFVAMKELVLNTALRQKLIQNSRKSITTRYNQQLVWEKLLQEYKLLD
ncbi:MAG: glycosyltransferase family 4 protein [Flavobacteriaceae bacterium]|nr:glycosyltransferase family 4 protein [Flavobacteriaceae bacterium]